MTRMASSPLFDLLNEDDRQVIFQVMRTRQVAAGDIFVHEGEIAGSLFVIVEGEIEVVKALGTPEENILGRRAAGDIIGEASLLNRENQRTASLRAVSTLSLLEMTHENFDSLLQQRPFLAYELARIISRREREGMEVIISDLQAKNRLLAQSYAELEAAQEQLIEKEKLEKELQVARTIQESILPASIPQLSEAGFGACMLPARLVGGDLYDVIPLGEGKMGVMVGDVSDKGIPAAIFMGVVRSLMRAEATRSRSPAETLQRVNELLLEMNQSGMFVTVLYGIYDPQRQTFAYARAGHELPMIFLADGQYVQPIMERGMLLGVFPDPPLDEQEVALPPGATLLIFSDGATDAVNSENVRLERSGLIATLRSLLGQPAQALCDVLLEKILAYQGEAQQADDITLVAMTVTP